MSEFKILQSTQDQSVNFVAPASVGYFEARYVRRERRYFSLYLSSQTGCNMGCRMCHLTATRQTKRINATLHDYMAQAREVFKWYDKQDAPAESVHFNFMARGEAFDNPEFINNATDILYVLGQQAMSRGLVPRFLISTIMPKGLIKDGGFPALAKMFPLVTPEIYYSIYSTNPDFRKKWLPNAMPVGIALHALRMYQDDKRIVPKLHWCFIKGENDSLDDVRSICGHVQGFGLQANLAIVRYNPYDATLGQESDDETIERNRNEMMRLLPGARVKKITRVGMDVKASCGMFVGPGA